jgi:Flp pilus assembly protein TadD
MGAVKGKVLGPDGKPIVGAEIIFKNRDTARTIKVKTDKHGEYFAMGLAPGQYDIRVLVNGSEVGKRDDAKVYGGQDGDPNNARFQNQFNFLPQRAGPSEEEQKQQEEMDQAKAGYERAVALNRGGQYTEALAELQPVLEKDPTQWVVHAQLAVAYMGLNRLGEAEGAFQKALELNPTDTRLLNSLGQLYVKMGRIEQARQTFDTIVQLSPGEAASGYYNLGLAFYNANDLKTAVEPFRKAAELDPNRADAHYLLGVCLYASAESKIEGGEVKTILPAGTRESFEKYLALAPNGQFANEAKAYLQAIDTTVPAAVRVKKK